jgi:LysR family transcriptional regulator, regulator for bpeEF and oprC
MRLLADMALFVEVANTRHFGRAASALDMPASTLSRRIRVLEKDLGVPLIHRSTRSFALTDAGLACYVRSRKLMAEATQIREDLADSAATAFGHLRVGLPVDLAQTIFLPMFAEFIRSNPGISVEVLNLQGQPSLLAEALDLAFLVSHQTSLRDSTQWSRRIGTFSRKLFASKQYLKRKNSPQQPSELTERDCILFSAGTLQKRWELRHGRERCTIDVKGSTSANSVGLLAQAAKEHMGIAMLPDFLAQHPLFGGGLVRVLPDWEGTPAHIFAVTPAQLLPGKTRRLVDFAKAQFNIRLAKIIGGFSS